MGDSSDDYKTRVVVDGVDDAVIADSNPIVVAPGEPGGSYRSGVIREAVDSGGDAVANWVVQAPIRSGRLRVQADFIPALGRCGYVRTSGQGSAASRSSRAWSAARLSSR